MTLGRAPLHADLFRSSTKLCEETLGETSLYRLLRNEGHRLFPDDAFADLFTSRGRRSISPHIVAIVMVLQRFEGLSDREALDRLTFDLRWKYAAGDLDFDYASFAHTVLCDMRARLRGSARPDRIFEAVLDVAKKAGLIGRKRVLDSTALYDAVATQDTVTLIRSAICGVLRVADVALRATLRAGLRRDDAYDRPGKPSCSWEDAAEREALVDALARDGQALLARLDGLALADEVKRAATLLVAVLGQDLEQRDDGVFRIVRGVAPDRVISTVDPEARHGHKTSAHGFDGYKGHVAVDPESEIVTSTAVTAANVGDARIAEDLIADLIAPANAAPSEPACAEPSEPACAAPSELACTLPRESANTAPRELATTLQVYGDAAYGTAEFLEKLDRAGIEANVKVQAPPARGGCYSQEAFAIDRVAGTATCPQGATVKLRVLQAGATRAEFGAHCTSCPQRPKCTASERGRVLSIHASFERLRAARARQRGAGWKQDYRATRPKVERKIAHLVRRRHGARRACVRGTQRVAQNFALVAAATNLARLAALRVRHHGGAWTAANTPG